MKRFVKVFGVIAIITALGLNIISCSNDEGGGLPGGGSSSEKTIIITGITGHTGTAQLWVFTEDPSTWYYGTVARGYIETINNNSVTFHLWDVGVDGYWTGSGPYVLYLMIREPNDSEHYYYYTNGRPVEDLPYSNGYYDYPKYNIISATSTISFSLFK